MKLCFLASATSIHSYRWVKYFADQGHEVYWFSTTPSIFDTNGIKFYEVKRSGFRLVNILFGAWQIQKVLKSLKPHLLHVHYAGVNGLIGALTGFHPLIITTWGSDVLVRGRHWSTKWLIRFILKQADLITCDAEHMYKALMKLGVAKNKIHIIYFGTDIEMFHPQQRSEELRRALGIGDSPIVISLRSLEPIYDVETLIRAIPFVFQEVPETYFIIAGDGSQRQKLKNLVKTLGISEKVIFTGFLTKDQLPKYLASADIYVSTSLSDAGLAASTAEAMACELPVIVTDSGENRLWVKDGENGFVVPVRNPYLLAEKIVYLLKFPEIRTKLGVNNRKVICERNNYRIEMAKMEALYEQIIERFHSEKL